MRRRSVPAGAAALLAAAALSTVASANSTRTLTLPYHGPLIGSGSLAEDFAGTAKFQVPSIWKAEKSGRYYELTPPAVDGCTIKMQVNNQPTLTKATPAAQVAAALPEGFQAARLGRGSRTHGSWGQTRPRTTPRPPGDAFTQSASSTSRATSTTTSAPSQPTAAPAVMTSSATDPTPPRWSASLAPRRSRPTVRTGLPERRSGSASCDPSTVAGCMELAYWRCEFSVRGDVGQSDALGDVDAQLGSRLATLESR